MSEFDNKRDELKKELCKCGDDSNKLKVQEEQEDQEEQEEKEDEKEFDKEEKEEQTKLFETNNNEIVNKFNESNKDLQNIKKILDNIKKPKRRQVSPDKNSWQRSRDIYICDISDELAMFLGVPSKTRMTRVVASALVVKYIQIHNLRDKETRNNFSLDTDLKKIFNNEDSISFVDITRRLAHHFTKCEKV